MKLFCYFVSSRNWLVEDIMKEIFKLACPSSLSIKLLDTPAVRGYPISISLATDKVDLDYLLNEIEKALNIIYILQLEVSLDEKERMKLYRKLVAEEI